MLVIQAGVVLGSATGGLPVMGQPLPLVAAAGSHLLFFCLPALATVLACTRLPLAGEVRRTTRQRRPWPQIPDPFPATISLHGPLSMRAPLSVQGPVSSHGAPSNHGLSNHGPVTEGGP